MKANPFQSSKINPRRCRVSGVDPQTGEVMIREYPVETQGVLAPHGSSRKGARIGAFATPDVPPATPRDGWQKR